MPSPKRETSGSQRPGANPKRQAEYLSQTRREHASEIAEDYVEAIADLISETGEARVVDLATRLGVTHVTVNRTIVRLALPLAGYALDSNQLVSAPCRAHNKKSPGRPGPWQRHKEGARRRP